MQPIECGIVIAVMFLIGFVAGIFFDVLFGPQWPYFLLEWWNFQSATAC